MSATATVQDRYTPDEVSAFYAAGFWKSDTLSDALKGHAVSSPDKVAMSDATTSVSYRDLYDKGTRLALGLKRLGLVAGDRIVVQLPNWTDVAVVVAATARLGLVIVPVMPIYRDDEVGYVIQHSGARAAITCEDFKGFNYLNMFNALKANAPELQSLIIARGGDVPAGVLRLDDLVADESVEVAEAQLGAGVGPDDPFLINYTSGTTARPKGCFHTWNTVRASATAIRNGLDYTADDVQFGPSPITHATGLVTSIALPLIVGASSHVMESWEPNEALERIKAHGCTAAVTATTFIQMLMNAYDADQHDVKSMRAWICAGSPIPGAVVERANELFPDLRVLSLYGRSENYLTTMCRLSDPFERSVTSDGSAVEGATVKIVDELGNEVPRGQEGDIAYRGPSHMLEYYRDPENTAALFTPDGFSRSGDLGVMDADGYVRVTGRLKDIVIRGGLNISARELEDLLVQHPAVGNVAAVGMPDERLGEKVCVYVVPADGQAPTLDDLTSFLRERKLATPKLPERLEIVDGLPTTATGKIQKHILRDDIAQKLKAGS